MRIWWSGPVVLSNLPPYRYGNPNHIPHNIYLYYSLHNAFYAYYPSLGLHNYCEGRGGTVAVYKFKVLKGTGSPDRIHMFF